VHNKGLSINVRLKRTPYIVLWPLYTYYALLLVAEYIFLIPIIAEAIKLAILYTFIYTLLIFNIFQY